MWFGNLQQWKILKGVWIHGGVVSELILDKRVAGYSGTFNFTIYPAGIIFLSKRKYITSGQIYTVVKIIENFFSSLPVGVLHASGSTFCNLKLAIVAALVCTLKK